MTNLVEILRKAPIGINLYSTMVGECKLSCVIGDEISIEFLDGKNTDYITLDQYGRFKEDGECVLFPSKYRQVWNGWQEWLFRDEMTIGKVVVDNMGGLFVLIKNDKNYNVKVADSNGEEFVISSSDVDGCRFATIEENVEFFCKCADNNCHWSNVDKTIVKQSSCDICKKEQPSHSCQDITELGRCRLEHEEPKRDICVHSSMQEQASNLVRELVKFLEKSNEISIEYWVEKILGLFPEEPKELYTDEEAKEFANKVSHEWWQIAMNKWNTLTEDEKKKYNQYIGFNDFSDHLMNILRSVLLGLKRNAGKLIYEEGSLFSEPDQKPAEIELDETPIPCYEPKGSYCNGNCGYCVYNTDAGCGRNIEYDKSGCDFSCEKFTIDDFKPFDKVLWRLNNADDWTIGFFNEYYTDDDDKIMFDVVGYEYRVEQCIPYNDDTKELHGTCKNCDKKYRTW